MKYISILFSIFLFINCGTTADKQIQDTTTLKQPVAVLAGKSLTDTAAKAKTSHPADSIIKGDYILFGKFCGECMGECATMYKLDIEKNTLYVDHTDSFWKYKYGDKMPIHFSEIVTDTAAIALAQKLNRTLPAFVTSGEKYGKVGCPDCTDGCGIYIETRRNNSIKQRNIDYQTSTLKGTVKKDVEYIKSIIDKM